MPKEMKFTNPNWESSSHFSLSSEIIPPKSSRKIGLHALDASNKIHQMVVDAEIKAIEAEEKSLVDTTTGCYNRKYYEKFKKENFDATRDHNKIAFVFVDLNGLKQINDTRGHEVGDNLIKYTAAYLNENFRAGDVVVRMGGDEFVVICRNNQDVENFEESLMLDSRINTRPLSDFDFGAATYHKSINFPPDFAYGIAVFDKEQDFDLDNTLKRADHLMYKHKIELEQSRQSI